jgi:hypothetical protein
MLAPGVGTDRRWNGILDELTNEIGLITCETVPTFRAGGRRSDLRLSSLPAGESAYDNYRRKRSPARSANSSGRTSTAASQWSSSK